MLFLANLLAEIGQDRLMQAVDLVSMRVRVVRAAKGAGGSWEKAAALTCLPSGAGPSAPIPDAYMPL